ncbi:MAG: hypothetical protein NWE95_00695 [Candidatus Bathyarchaeota archaeon]|nr:hypothetical protein [Candidatus Bathyarchaeota archaeon]
MQTSENGEAAFVAVGSACVATATYVATQPIPDAVKAPVCAIVGSVGVALLAYWKAKINVNVASSGEGKA